MIMRKIILILFIFTVAMPCSAKKPNWYMSELRKISYKGGDGSTFEKAIIIKKAETMEIGIAAEYVYIQKKQGKIFKKWRPIDSSLEKLNDKYYSTIYIQKISDTTINRKYVFDVTGFYGKLYQKI